MARLTVALAVLVIVAIDVEAGRLSRGINRYAREQLRKARVKFTSLWRTGRKSDVGKIMGIEWHPIAKKGHADALLVLKEIAGDVPQKINNGMAGTFDATDTVAMLLNYDLNDFKTCSIYIRLTKMKPVHDKICGFKATERIEE